jgi:uncharacterized protein YndB with AHSA1/START domain
MANTHIAKTQITIHASPAEVWKALTTPALIKKYLMGADVHTDWKVGSPIVYTGTYQGKPYREKGVIQRILPEKLFEATHFSESSGKEDKPENYALVSWQLEKKDGETIVVVTQDNIANEQGVEGAKKNWGGVLQGLKQTVEA